MSFKYTQMPVGIHPEFCCVVTQKERGNDRRHSIREGERGQGEHHTCVIETPFFLPSGVTGHISMLLP